MIVLNSFLVLFLLWAAPLIASPGGQLAPVAAMASPRAKHSATLLYNGKVLIAGGIGSDGNVLATAELYDPATAKFTPTGSMTQARAAHGAVRLTNGTVLIVGGTGSKGALDSCELYDPMTGQFSQTTSLHTPRTEATATRLQDDRVLVAGGVGPDGQSLASTEIYERNAKFISAAAMSTPRTSHSATLLPHERVLIAGGVATNESLNSAELYDAEANRFMPLPNMTTARERHTAVSIPDQYVLIVGGTDRRGQQGISTTEIFDVESRKFSQGAPMLQPRFDIPEPVVLSSSRVLVVGATRSGEVYDPATKMFAAAGGKIEHARWFQTETLLSDGKVLITGGFDEKKRSTAQAWIYTP